MQFLSPMTQSRALAASINAQGVQKTVKELRKLIPVELLLRMQTEAAVTGLLPAYDKHTGEEVAAATPVDVKTRLELARFLTNKRMADPKAAEDEGRDFDPSTLPTTLKEAQELTPAELDAAIAASFTIQENTPCPTPPPSHPLSSTPAKTTDGSSSPSISDPTPPPSDRFPFLGKPRPKPTGGSVSTTPSTSNG